MRKLFQYIIPVGILSAGILFSVGVGYGKKEYTVKEKKACNYCHKEAAPKDGNSLTEAGTYYKEHDHSLTGYTPSTKK